MPQTNYQILIQKLDRFIRKYYKNLLIRGGIYSVAAVLVFYITVVVLEYYGHFNTTIRTVLFYAFLLSTAYILTKFIFISLFKLYKLGDTITYEQAAAIIGKHFSEVQDRLLNVLQLKKLLDTQSSALVEASIDQKIAHLNPVPFTSAIDLSKNKKYLKYTILPILLIIMLSFIAPNIVTDGTKRLINHNTYFEKVAPFQFVIANDKLQAVQQEDFQLNVEITGDEIPNEVFIEIDARHYKLKKDNTINFHYVFKNIQETIVFKFFADGIFSKKYKLVALPNPLILNFEINLNYPKYTGKKDEIVENTGDLIIPEGTQLNWLFKTKNTEKLELNFCDSNYSLLQQGADNYSLTQRFFKSQSYSITTANKYLQNKESIHYAISVIPDLYPSIDVEESKDSLSPKRLYFSGLLKDDYGFKRLTFNYQLIESEDASNVKELITTDININKNTTHAQFFHYWDIIPLDIKAGDRIEYYFEVWDNDGVNGSKSTRSRTNVFKAPTLKELEQQAEKSNKQIKEELKESILQAKKLQKDLKDLDKKMLEKKKLGWQEKNKLEKLLEQQRELQNKVENVQQQHLKNLNQQKEYRKIDESILEKQQQLEKLFEKIMTPEMKELFDELEKLLEEMDKQKLQEMMEEMKLSNKDIEKELDRTLEIFKQLEVEQKLEETREKLEKLTEKQKDLSEESLDKKTNSEDLKQKQDDLNKEFEDIKKDLDDLEKKNNELEMPNKIDNTEQEEKNIDEQMQNSSNQLQENKKKKSSQSQKNAAQEMKKLNDKLAQMQESMQMENQGEDLNAMRDLLENLIQLSFDQEELMEELKKTRPNDPKYRKLTQRQKKIKDDAKMIEDSLFALSKRVIQIESMVNREIAAINSNMEKTIKLLSEQPPNQVNAYINKATGRQQYIMTSINNLALLLDEVVQQMQQQMANQKAGQGSCNKPGKCKKPGHGKPFSNMKKMQDELNKQIQQLKDQIGKKPGGKRGDKSRGRKLSEQLAKLAAQQEALRNEIRKMAKELNKQGNFQGKNKLDNLSKLMEETETDLVNKRITQETIRRQQKILTRLLEHEKAEREREMEEKRQSKEANNYEKRNPSEFFEYNRLKQKEVELLKTIPLSLHPFYKNKVNEYFNNFNNQ